MVQVHVYICLYLHIKCFCSFFSCIILTLYKNEYIFSSVSISLIHATMLRGCIRPCYESVRNIWIFFFYDLVSAFTTLLKFLVDSCLEENIQLEVGKYFSWRIECYALFKERKRGKAPRPKSLFLKV